MYAIFQSGSKQHRVSKGQIILLEKLNIEIGKSVLFDKVLMIVNGKEIEIGSPFLKKGVVEAEIITHSRGKKLKIVKFHRRKHYRKRQNHRQWFTHVKITDINIK